MRDFWNGLSKTAKFAFVVILVLVILGLASTAARAQACNTLDAAMEVLGETYGETLIFDGVQSDGSHVMATGNSETGTWSILIVRGDIACLSATGRSFDAFEAKPNV